MQMYPSVSYLGNGQTDCAEIRCVVRDELAGQSIQVRDGVHMYPLSSVGTYAPPFRIWGTAGRIALKFGI